MVVCACLHACVRACVLYMCVCVCVCVVQHILSGRRYKMANTTVVQIQCVSCLSIHLSSLPPLPPFRQFSLVGVPLVDGLRSFLETFRLPGEAPVISLILEQFATHWLVRGGYIYSTSSLNYLYSSRTHFSSLLPSPSLSLPSYPIPSPCIHCPPLALLSPSPLPLLSSPPLPLLFPSPLPLLSSSPLTLLFSPPSHVQDCNKDDIGKVFANPDAVYVLSYSILMLNTDQHNPLVKNRMTMEVGYKCL